MLTKQIIDDMATLCQSALGERGLYKCWSELSSKNLTGDYGLEVKPSLYGLGVFATKPFKKDDYITLYPAHLIINMRDKIPKLIDYLQTNTPEDLNYAMATNDNKILVQGNPAIYGGICYGHMINDPSPNVDLFNKATSATVKKIIKQYEKDSMMANTKYTPSNGLIWIKATKDINVGDELTVSYGHRYWMKNVLYLIKK